MTRARLLMGTLGVILMLAITSGTATAAPSNSTGGAAQSIGTDGADVVANVTFSAASDVFTYNVDLEAGFDGTTLAVGTRDCCLIGDKWGVTISAPGFTRVAQACGTGSTRFYTGIALLGSALRPLTDTATVTVYYCSGTDVFPAGLEVRFHYNGDGMTVTPQS